MQTPSVTLADFIGLMQAGDTQRAWIIYDPEAGRVRGSHSFLDPFVEWLDQDRVDFDRHEGLFMALGAESGTLQLAAVHNTVRGQAAGGVRFWQYQETQEFLLDGVRLARGMTHKNALAGLWWGGGKGVIARPEDRDYLDPDFRGRVYRDFGRLITSLKGCYVTAEDVGTHTVDMAQVYSTTRFTTCIPADLGGSGNPSAPTARGVVSGIEAALDHLNEGAISGHSFAVQGIGNVGEPLIRFLLERGADRVIAGDVDPHRIRNMEQKYTDDRLELRLYQRDDMSLLFENVDVVSPCATGAILNRDTIPLIQARVVCGAANNQLQVPLEDGKRLQQRGIVYIPDFLVNRMGIVNCANEQYGYPDGTEDVDRHLDKDWEYSIYQMSRRILSRAAATGEATNRQAIQLAEEYARIPHPIWGHRGHQIIQGLIKSGWENGTE